jgi:hypothetical protein
MMTWRREKPTSSGWYWYREPEAYGHDWTTMKCLIWDVGSGELRTDNYGSLKLFPGEWAGPLQPPGRP